MNPIETIQQWRDDAQGAGDLEPDRMAIATVREDGRPSVRMVLLRGLRDRELHFYTNYESQKAEDLQQHPFAAGLLHWMIPVHRQVRVEGPVRRLEAELSDSYFASRPRGHQIAAWASPQSRPIVSLDELRERAAEISRRFEGQPVPRPPHWGGFALIADRVELWISGADRLHDRRLYLFEADRWRELRLGP